MHILPLHMDCSVSSWGWQACCLCIWLFPWRSKWQKAPLGPPTASQHDARRAGQAFSAAPKLPSNSRAEYAALTERLFWYICLKWSSDVPSRPPWCFASCQHPRTLDATGFMTGWQWRRRDELQTVADTVHLYANKRLSDWIIACLWGLKKDSWDRIFFFFLLFFVFSTALSFSLAFHVWTTGLCVCSSTTQRKFCSKWPMQLYPPPSPLPHDLESSSCLVGYVRASVQESQGATQRAFLFIQFITILSLALLPRTFFRGRSDISFNADFSCAASGKQGSGIAAVKNPPALPPSPPQHSIPSA